MSEREPPGARMPVHEQWTCGHVATAMCAECYEALAHRANLLAKENDRLRDIPRDIRIADRLISERNDEIERLQGQLAFRTQVSDQLAVENERLRAALREAAIFLANSRTVPAG